MWIIPIHVHLVCFSWRTFNVTHILSRAAFVLVWSTPLSLNWVRTELLPECFWVHIDFAYFLEYNTYKVNRSTAQFIVIGGEKSQNHNWPKTSRYSIRWEYSQSEAGIQKKPTAKTEEKKQNWAWTDNNRSQIEHRQISDIGFFWLSRVCVCVFAIYCIFVQKY